MVVGPCCKRGPKLNHDSFPSSTGKVPTHGERMHLRTVAITILDEKTPF